LLTQPVLSTAAVLSSVRTGLSLLSYSFGNNSSSCRDISCNPPRLILAESMEE
jgi:hypothetical protein